MSVECDRPEKWGHAKVIGRLRVEELGQAMLITFCAEILI